MLCLLGDNGAGKSTLIKIMSGVHGPSPATSLMDGEPVAFKTPRDASERGIATVHQFGGTFPLMSIGRSFFVGVEPTKGWGPFKVFDRKKANEIAVKSVQDFGITRIDDGDRLVGGLSGGERQSLAIARAVLFRRPRADPRRADGGTWRQAGEPTCCASSIKPRSAAWPSSSSPIR